MQHYVQPLLAVYCVAMLALLLWPFGFELPCKECRNGATWIVKEEHIEFRAPGLVRSASPPTGLYERLTSGDGLTLETWLTTYGLDQGGPARIVSYSQSPHFRNFTLGQQNGDLIFRLRHSKTSPNGMSPEIVVPDVFVPGKRHHIVVTYDFSKVCTYIDGRLRDSVDMPEGSFDDWDTDHLLLLGNEETGDRPWIGSIASVAIYDRPLSAGEIEREYESDGVARDHHGSVALFDFSGGEGNVVLDMSGIRPATDLEIPRIFNNEGTPDFFAVKPRLATDFITNAAIFFPFGFLLFLSLSGTIGGTNFPTVAVVFLAILLFSLTTESLQYFVAARTSSLYDFASCITGGIAGVIAAIVVRPLLPFS